MDGFGGVAGIEESSNPQDLKPFGANPTGDAKFDASQYAFFDNNMVEEVELGGLEDEEDDLPPVGLEDEEFLLDKEEDEALESLSEIDDLASTFSKRRGEKSCLIPLERPREAVISLVGGGCGTRLGLYTRKTTVRTFQCN